MASNGRSVSSHSCSQVFANIKLKHQHVYQQYRTLPFVVVKCVSAACQIYKPTLSHLIATFAVGMYLQVTCHRIDACVFYFCEWCRRSLKFGRAVNCFRPRWEMELSAREGLQHQAASRQRATRVSSSSFSIFNKWPPCCPFSFCFCCHTLGGGGGGDCSYLWARIHKCHDTRRLRSIYLQDACC